MNDIEAYSPEVTPTYVPPPFPAWPPPSGGYPNTTPEQGPILNPYPYGSPQGSNISIGNPAPPPRATFFPDELDPANGQNQGGSNALPPSTRPWEGGPKKADPAISAIHPPPIMGPGPQGTAPWEMGPLAGNPAPGRTFPAGSYLDGYGAVITPSAVKVVGSGTSTP